MSIETKDKLSKAKKGRVANNKDKKTSSTIKNKIKLAIINLYKNGYISPLKKAKLKKECAKCKVIFYVKPSLDRVKHCSRSCAKKGKPSPNLGKTASLETRAKQSAKKKGIRGKNHWNFKHGLRRGKIEMSSGAYFDWRMSVFKRDDFTCQVCFIRGIYLEAHHIKRFNDYPELRLDINNGISLCKSCHNKTKNREKEFEHAFALLVQNKNISLGI
jgi:hypothetical protein